METSRLYCLGGYDYQLGAYPTPQGNHRGLIFLVAFSGTSFSPAIKMLQEKLIHTGAIDALLPLEDTILRPVTSTNA